jgi:hypothetical protein
MVPMNQSNPVWKVLKEESVYEARPFLEVWQQEVKLPDGSIIPDYHRVWVIDYALIWAETSDGKVILEKQYKHGVGEVTCTFPSGGIEPGESPQLAAERELLEETGYTATAWESLGAYPVQGNYGCGRAHFFPRHRGHSNLHPPEWRPRRYRSHGRVSGRNTHSDPRKEASLAGLFVPGGRSFCLFP